MRLTKSIREEIIDAVVNEAVEKRNKRLVDRWFNLAEEIFNSLVPKHERDIIKSLPPHFLPQVQEFRLGLPGNTQTNAALSARHFRISERAYYTSTVSMPLRTARKVPYVFRDTYEHSVNSLSAPLRKKLKSLLAAAETFNEHKKALRTKLETAVNSCSTDKTLIEQYPDLKKHTVAVVAAHTPKREKQLAIRAEDIHAAIICAKTGRKCK